MARTRKTQEKDVLARLADAGEDALQRLVDLLGSKAILDAIGPFRERLDEMAVKVRTLDPLERRVAAIEKRLVALEKPKKPARRAATATRKTTTSTKRPSS
jgi:hypothetical protein